MFGRDFNPVYLFHTTNADAEEEYLTSEDEALIDNEIRNECIYEPTDNPDEWVENMDTQRHVD